MPKRNRSISETTRFEKTGPASYLRAINRYLATRQQARIVRNMQDGQDVSNRKALQEE